MFVVENLLLRYPRKRIFGFKAKADAHPAKCVSFFRRDRKMYSGIMEQLCRSCGMSFVLDLSKEAAEVKSCRKCREARLQFDEGILGLRPRSSAAKRLLEAAKSARTTGKYLQAKDLVIQLTEQIALDAQEAQDRKEREKAKKERWHARQADRKSRDHAETMARRGK